MITWIQTVLQKHHKSVFGVLLVAIIIAFVFTIGSVPFFGDRYRTGGQKGKVFYGFDLSNESTLAQLQNSAYFEMIFEGVQPQSEAQFTQYVLRQAYLRNLANELGMTRVSQADLEAYIQSSPLFAGADGKYAAAAFKRFVDSRIGAGRMSEAALSEIVSQNALVNKVGKLLGGPGYMPAFEIEREYNQVHGTWDFNMAVLSSDELKLKIAPSAEVLEKYFKDNIEAYRIGEGVVVETAFFPSKDFSADIKPTEAELSAYYAANRAKYETTKDGKPHLPKLSEIRESVKADYVIDNALRAAAHKAEEFALKIYDAEVKKGSAELKKIADEFNVALKKNAAFRTTDAKLPDGFPVEVAAAAMKLDETKFYSDPIPSNDGVRVVFLSEKLDSFLPKYADVKDRVLADYVAAEKVKLFAEHANNLAKSLQKAVAEKKSFESAARAGGAKVESVKDFSLANPKGDAVLKAYGVISSALPSLKVGAVSSVKMQGGSAYIFELVKFTPPAKSDKAQLDSVKERIERSFGAITSTSVIMEKISSGEKDVAEK